MGVSRKQIGDIRQYRTTHAIEKLRVYRSVINKFYSYRTPGATRKSFERIKPLSNFGFYLDRNFFLQNVNL